MHRLAVSERREQFLERLPDLVETLQDLGARKDSNVVFREIHARFEQRDELHQLFLDGREAARECAFELLRGDLRLVQRLRFDEVADGFGLREIEASVEKGAHGELTWLGEACAAREAELDHM